MSGRDRRQAVMAVANMVESLLRGSGPAAGEPDGEDQQLKLSRLAIVYVRQSTVAQMRFNTESAQRQYGLVGTAAEFGWLAEQIVVVDADLGMSGRAAHRRRPRRRGQRQTGRRRLSQPMPSTTGCASGRPPLGVVPADAAAFWDDATQEIYRQKVAGSFRLKPIAPAHQLL
ncbi:hypothetical protein ACLQ2S_24820 [Micromonospora sp. DT48]|uniref:hypothetical protein n=1 Tax=unclassified Micromonospora TaxID=2617518 RepID=UPI0012BD61AF|nr:hypothetical protein [Micromonospora sp. CP22]MTK05195.1 hypothetical protein [Micromonospora sp. CP22]